jgi:serine/threonine-protein kinase
MEYVEGESLAVVQQVLRHRSERMPLGVALAILEDVAAGLHAAHELCDERGRPQLVVHRDVTPHNILLGTDGVSRLTDFGVAKAQSRLTKTSPGLVKGKVTYMSPEQAQGRPLDRTCDVWALGVVAWELFTATRMYDGLAAPVVMLKIARHEPTRARHVRADLPRELDDVVARALTLSADERFETAQAFADALSEAARGAGIARADAREVGSFLSALIGPRLEARREKATKTRELRRRLDAFDPATPHELSRFEEPTRVMAARPSSPPDASDDLAATLEPERRSVSADVAPLPPTAVLVLRSFAYRLITAPLRSRAWLLASFGPVLLVALVWALSSEPSSARGRARASSASSAKALPARAVNSATTGPEEAPVITPQDLAVEPPQDAGERDANAR